MDSPRDRIAKRRAEIKEQQAALDRGDAQRYITDNNPGGAAIDRGKGGALRSAAFLILVVVAAAGLFGLAVTLTRLAGKDFGDARRQGTAQVTSCVQHGPISNEGFGLWER